MWALIIAFLENIFGQFINKKPDVMQEGEKAGAATSALAGEEQANDMDVKAATAAAAADRATDTDAGLRKYEATDPANRDNDKP